MTDDEVTEDEWKALEVFTAEFVRPFIRPGKYETAIKRLRARLEVETKTGVRGYLLQELVAVLWADGRDEEALSTIHQWIDLQPNNPISRCALATWHSLRERQPNPDSAALRAALEAIDEAVEIARLHGGDLRYCLNARCRIAIAMQRYDVLEKTLREILETIGLPGIQFEGDFLPHIPDGAIDADLLAEYKMLLAEQATRRAKRRSSS